VPIKKFTSQKRNILSKKKQNKSTLKILPIQGEALLQVRPARLGRGGRALGQAARLPRGQCQCQSHQGVQPGVESFVEADGDGQAAWP